MPSSTWRRWSRSVSTSPLLVDQQIDLINAGIDDLCETHEIELNSDATARLQQAWSDSLVHYLDQPRAVKRLLTQVDAFWGEVAGEAMIKERSPRNPRAVGAVLAEMFLVLRSARENMTYDSEYKDDVRRRSGVGSAEFFDRYIQLGMLANDLPDKLVATAIVPILGQHYLRAWDQQSGLFGSAGGHQMRGLARRILDRCDGPEGVELLTDLTRHGPSSLRLASDIVRGAKSSDDDRDVVRPWLDAAADVVAEALEAELRGAAGKRLNESPEITGQLYAYRHLVGDETARALLWELLEGRFGPSKNSSDL